MVMFTTLIKINLKCVRKLNKKFFHIQAKVLVPCNTLFQTFEKFENILLAIELNSRGSLANNYFKVSKT